MTNPSEADRDHSVDQKLDSLISRIQLLGGEGKHPAQASKPVLVLESVLTSAQALALA